MKVFINDDESLHKVTRQEIDAMIQGVKSSHPNVDWNNAMSHVPAVVKALSNFIKKAKKCKAEEDGFMDISTEHIHNVLCRMSFCKNWKSVRQQVITAINSQLPEGISLDLVEGQRWDGTKYTMCICNINTGLYEDELAF